jgi:hypothetical protein
MKAKLSLRLATVLLVGAVVLGTPLTLVSAATPITGLATHCSGLASCTFSLTDGNGGTGTATASAGVGGYVGQSPLPFSGGYVTFQLPGDALPTYAYGVYSGQAVLDGYSSTAGTLYNTTGTFSALDVNTGLVVTGTTNTVVGIKGHSGRGGGNIYTLVGGTISISETSLHTTSTSVTCSPTPIAVNAQTYCTATVTDTIVGTPVTPTGSVTFSSSGAGTFGSASCSLFGTGANATCLVGYTPASGTEGTQTITANYPGDSTHLGSTSASFTITAEKRSTSTSLSCTSPFHINVPTTCTVTVLDTSPGNLLQPSGNVKFASNHPGRFSSTTCSLNENNDIVTCSVKFTPTRTAAYTIKATYVGDSDYFGSTTSQTFKVL